MIPFSSYGGSTYDLNALNKLTLSDQETKQVQRYVLQNLPLVVVDSTENVVVEQTSSSRSHRAYLPEPRRSDSPPSNRQMESKTCIDALSQRCKLRDMQADQYYSLQRRNRIAERSIGVQSLQKTCPHNEFRTHHVKQSQQETKRMEVSD